MKIAKKTQLISLLLFVIATGTALPLSAQNANAPFVQFPVFRYFDVKPAPKTWGIKADALLGFRIFDGVDTALWVRGEAAYKLVNYFRTGDLGLYRQDIFPDIGYDRTNLQKAIMLWGLGIQQGLHFNAARDRDDAMLLLSWRGAWTIPTSFNAADALLRTGSDPYKDQILVNSFQADFLYDDANTDPVTKVRSGWWFDLSAEYAPPGISIPASVNYAQFSTTTKGFLPLFSRASERGWNEVSVYLGASASVDYIAGFGTDATNGIPYPVSQRFGGRVYQEGLGGAVRGLGEGWADGTFKLAGSLELRCNLPAVYRSDILVGTLAFLDAGYYAAPPGMPKQSALQSGTYVTTGLGVYLDVFDKGYIAAYSTVMLNAVNYQNKYWEPLSFELGLHF
ncbi:MAG TPA: hypothetical protein PKO22_01855 [Treponemataceae bacterium]|nr:hypothetical protein [Treponemataceae bacterium]